MLYTFAYIEIEHWIDANSGHHERRKQNKSELNTAHIAVSDETRKINFVARSPSLHLFCASFVLSIETVNHNLVTEANMLIQLITSSTSGRGVLF